MQEEPFDINELPANFKVSKENINLAEPPEVRADLLEQMETMLKKFKDDQEKKSKEQVKKNLKYTVLFGTLGVVVGTILTALTDMNPAQAQTMAISAGIGLSAVRNYAEMKINSAAFEIVRKNAEAELAEEIWKLIPDNIRIASKMADKSN